MSKERNHASKPENPFEMSCDDRRINLYLNGSSGISMIDRVLVAMHLLHCDRHELPSNFSKRKPGLDK
jgi:hypothetical protein